MVNAPFLILIFIVILISPVDRIVANAKSD